MAPRLWPTRSSMSSAPLTPHFALILDAVAPQPSPRVTDLAVWSDADWHETARIAAWHRLTPLLFTAVRGHEAVSHDVQQRLESDYLANAARNLFLADAARRAFAALSDAGVQAMALKGAALVTTVYPDPAVREMLDIDILVGPNDMAAAHAALAPLGYAAAEDESEAGADHARVVAKHHDPALVGRNGLLAIELHRHIAMAGEARGFSILDLWKRARPAAGDAHMLPSPEDLLLHVCLHFTRNRLGGSHHRMNTGGALAQIADIARIVTVEPLDWELLARAARAYATAPAVFLALFAARELGVAVPADALAEIRPAGFDPALGRRLVALRVLRTGAHLPVRSTRFVLMPDREVLRRGWGADPTAPLSLARAYIRRAWAQLPRFREALRRPWAAVQDQRLNRQIAALQEHP